MSHEQPIQDVERPLLRLRDCYWFFGPLVLMVELNMMSKSVIHAFLARTDSPSAALAAFNAAFTFYFADNGCVRGHDGPLPVVSEVAGRLSTIEHFRRHRSLTSDYDLANRGLYAGRQHGVWKLVRPRFTSTVGGTRGCWSAHPQRAIPYRPRQCLRAADARPPHIHYHLEHSGPAAVADGFACASAHVAERRRDRRCSACHLYGDRGDLCLDIRLAASDRVAGHATV